VPSHQGQTIVDGEPPRRETMRPVPRQGGQRGVSSWVGSPDSAMGRLRLACGGVDADGRFAPSPTGSLHVGNLRTALLAWLFARSQGARFLVRVEDLDAGRVRRRFEDEQLADLGALGLDWDGPAVRQSERSALYEAALERLTAAGLLYECWCTRAEIREAASAPHGALPEGAYPGTCLRLSAAERDTRRAAGRPAALRVRADGARVTFEDRLCGPVEGVVDDFVVRRNDGAFAYNLAVVVDDAAQGIREVVRGADLLDSTPRQLWLGARLGLPAPGHAHVPLMLGPDGARLAKRHGAVTLADRAALGQSPDDVRAELAASVGLGEPGERLAPHELVARFHAGRLAAVVAS
jgi:glutamyl-tRNA synthetase